jgi:ADP-heptose:LPS heptosyltransferase
MRGNEMIKAVKLILRHIRAFFFFLVFDKVSVLFAGNCSSKKEGVAIIRVDAIGDFILWLDSAKAFRELFPEKKITLIGNEVWEDLARCYDYWDEMIAINRAKLEKNLLYRFRTLRMLRKKNFEIVVQPTYSREFISGDAIVKATAAKERIGSVGDFSNISRLEKAISDKWYTKLVPASEKPLMEIERNAEFVINLGARHFSPKIPSIPPLESGKSMNINKPYFVVVPGAQMKKKMWEPEKFVEIIRKLVERTRWTCVLCGNKKEFQICKEIAQKSGVAAINMAGKTKLLGFIEVIRNAELVVSNDTSAVHISASVGTPSVCILGGGHFGRFLPYPEYLSDKKTKLPLIVYNKMDCFGCNWRCDHKDYKEGENVPCIKSISVDEVWGIIEKILEDRKED